MSFFEFYSVNIRHDFLPSGLKYDGENVIEGVKVSVIHIVRVKKGIIESKNV